MVWARSAARPGAVLFGYEWYLCLCGLWHVVVHIRRSRLHGFTGRTIVVGALGAQAILYVTLLAGRGLGERPCIGQARIAEWSAFLF